MVRFVNQNFVATYFNYDRPWFDSSPVPSVQGKLSDRGADYRDGYGSGQVCIYFCTSDGRILNRLDGFVHPATLVGEADWALSLNRIAHLGTGPNKVPDLLQRAVAARTEELSAAVGRAESRIDVEPVATSAEVLDRARYRWCMSAELSQKFLLRRTEPFLLQVFNADNVTTETR